jgi:hypothetical protein
MTVRILLSVALGILFAAPEAAMAGKFTKQAIDMQNVPVPVRRELVPPKNTESLPGLTIEEFLGQKQARIQDINKRQIVHLRHIIQLSGADDAQLPDYYFRLGELFAENFRYWNNLARSLDEAIFRAEHASTSAAEVRRGTQ